MICSLPSQSQLQYSYCHFLKGNMLCLPFFRGGSFFFWGTGPVSVCERQEGTTEDLACSRGAGKRDRKKPRKQEGNHNRKKEERKKKEESKKKLKRKERNNARTKERTK